MGKNQRPNPAAGGKSAENATQSTTPHPKKPIKNGKIMAADGKFAVEAGRRAGEMDHAP